MNKEFVPYEQALALKELGFDEPCFSYYKNNQLSEILEKVINSEIKNVNNEIDDYISAPLYQQAFRWFREKYKIGYNITWNKFYENTPYQWEVRKYWENEPTIPYGYAGMSKTYEEAELACLNKLIEIIKQEIEKL